MNEANSSENQQQAAEQAIKHLTRVFRARDGRQRNVSSTVGEMVEIGPDTVVIAATHLPGHFVTTEVEHLGQSEKNVAITRTDSFCAMNSMDHFQGEAHNALRVAFTAMKLIGEKAESRLLWSCSAAPGPARLCILYADPFGGEAHRKASPI